MPVKYIATTFLDGNRVVVRPHDTSYLTPTVQALVRAGFSAFPFSKKDIVVPFSPLSGSEREKVCDQVKRLSEESKVAIRNIRKNARQKSEDVKSVEKELQRLTDFAIERIERAATAKIQSL